jgi:hypothetical protein
MCCGSRARTESKDEGGRMKDEVKIGGLRPEFPNDGLSALLSPFDFRLGHEPAPS